jgi:two-component system OmpR family sensor kinase
MGLLVYGIQQSFMLNNTRNRLSELVQATVESTEISGDTLTRLAVALGDSLRILGADVFVKDAQGQPVPPSLGTGPWLADNQHQEALVSQQGGFLRLNTNGSDRLVYLAPIIDPNNQPLGTVEASLTLEFVETELATLRRWLTIVIGGATLLAVLLSLLIAEIARQPIGGLVNTADKVAHGDMDTRASLPNVQEVRQLAATFNTMLDRIQRAMSAQKQTTEEMRRFAADASHELRSPLAVFRNGVDLLQKALARGDTDQVDQVVSLLRTETDSMTRLVNDLLLLARMESTSEGSQREMTLVPVEPLPLLEEVYERALLLRSAQNMELIWPDTTTHSIYADRDLLRRALNNLVENALRHTPDGKSIYLKVAYVSNVCQFIIQDEGSGIPSEDLPFIFDRFYRGDSARSRKSPSTGLGLAIVKAIVQAHGGEIQAHSTFGQGTTFVINLPHTTLPTNQ